MLNSKRPYPTIHRTSAGILVSALINQPRSFSNDAQNFIQRLEPPLKILGEYPNDAGRGLIIAVNHYSRPGFGAWWIALAIAGTCPWEMHWSVTAAWTYDDPLRSRVITPLSRWFLHRLARIYGFTSMPPMPPRPEDVEQRALAVRHLLRYVDHHDQAVIGLAPEGADSHFGDLMPPPPGIGRLIAQLVRKGLQILPVAVYETDRDLILSIGSLIKPEIPRSRQEQELQLSELTMRAIAALLPPPLRGAYT